MKWTSWRSVVLVYVLLSLALWSTPLLRILHVESSALVALVAFFVAGLSSLSGFARGMSFRRMLMRHEAALFIPWVLLTVTLLWTPN